jgi:hypothetical protein
VRTMQIRWVHMERGGGTLPENRHCGERNRDIYVLDRDDGDVFNLKLRPVTGAQMDVLLPDPITLLAT